MRGFAAVGVVCSHLSLSFARENIPPSDGGRDGPTRLFQRPVFRLIVQGQAFLALFFILTGFVNSLKPLKQTQANNVERALVQLAHSSFNRIPRLILPAAAVTVITWFACQLGFFELARHSNAYWLAINSKQPSPSWFSATQDLVTALRDTWVWAENPYDQPQWALPYLLKASMYIFVMLLITSTTRPTFRLCAFAMGYCWSWVANDSLVGLNVFAGMIVAELHTMHVYPDLTSAPLRVAPFIFALLGLYLMSFPTEYWDWQPWTRRLTWIGWKIFPYGADYSRYWCAIGAQLLCVSAQVSPDLRRALSTRLSLFLGSISFSMYLLHGPLMRSVLAWMTFGPSWFFKKELVDGALPRPAASAFLIILPLFASVLLATSSVWTYKVEPYFGRVTKTLQDLAAKDHENVILPK